MLNIKGDPVYNAIYAGIIRGIKLTLANECYQSAVILIYSGIDIMAALTRPACKDKATRKDFKDWVDRYVNLRSPLAVSAEELYSARCATLHTLGVESDLTRSGTSRRIGYTVGSRRAIHYDPSVSTDLVLVDIPSLAEAFFSGVNRSLIEAFSDPKLQPLIELRITDLLSICCPSQ